MGSIAFLSYRLEEAAWNSPRIVVGKVLELGSFTVPGFSGGEAALGFTRVVILRALKGEGLVPGQELRIFSSAQLYFLTHAAQIRDGVVSYAQRHYHGGLDSGQVVPGTELLVFLGEEPAAAGFPPGAAFTSMEGSFDRGDREAAVLKALEQGPYGRFDHRITLQVGGRVRLPDDLEVRLVAHSHKRPMTGGPTCESTLLKLSKDGTTGDLQLNHSAEPDGAQSWGKQEWGAYGVELHGMAYDVSSEIVVRKR